MPHFVIVITTVGVQHCRAAIDPNDDALRLFTLCIQDITPLGTKKRSTFFENRTLLALTSFLRTSKEVSLQEVGKTSVF